jgi:hypothetical protein
MVRIGNAHRPTAFPVSRVPLLHGDRREHEQLPTEVQHRAIHPALERKGRKVERVALRDSSKVER